MFARYSYEGNGISYRVHCRMCQTYYKMDTIVLRRLLFIMKHLDRPQICKSCSNNGKGHHRFPVVVLYFSVVFHSIMFATLFKSETLDYVYLSRTSFIQICAHSNVERKKSTIFTIVGTFFNERIMIAIVQQDENCNTSRR
jgi:hypothetical protein